MLLDARTPPLRLDEFQPRVLTSFVRNQLIDDVYLPLIGDNLAKQIGAAGDTQTHRSHGPAPPHLPARLRQDHPLEYLASRLGLIFVKINGPALGHAVTSLDPEEAPNAAAREEIHKLNLALEMGDNVMLCVDDIQHCHAEFLQKFISLCDGQRKIEGVWRGSTRTYDLRGRKVVVVMAGNPYTESGRVSHARHARQPRRYLQPRRHHRRHAEAFKASYLENAVTSNPVLAPLANKQPEGHPRLHPHRRDRPARAPTSRPATPPTRSRKSSPSSPNSSPSATSSCASTRNTSTPPPRPMTSAPSRPSASRDPTAT
jgi:hypothetical protein